MEQNNEFNLLLDLDGMFDTRMGTLLSLHSDLPSVLPIHEYRRRTIDDWDALTKGAVTTEAFNEAYAKRDLDTLKRSIISGMVPVLMNYIDSLQSRFFRGVDVSSVSVDMNTWPYALPGPLAETFKNCLRTLMPTFVNVNAVSIKPETMTPLFLKTHYSGWVTYSHHAWLEMHQLELLGNPINGVAVITPKLLVKVLGEDEHSEVFKDVDKHGLLEMVMEDYLHIEHVPVSDFCFVLPKTYQLPEDDEDDVQLSSSMSSRMARSDASTEVTKSS